MRTEETILLLGALGVGGYFAYQWWQQKQQAAAAGSTATPALASSEAPPAQWSPPPGTEPQPAPPPTYPYGLSAEEFGKLSPPIQAFLEGKRREVFAATVYYDGKARLLRWPGSLDKYKAQIAALAKYDKVRRIELATLPQRFAPGRTYAQIVAELTRNIG